MPTLIIGLHFISQVKIINRKIDYLVTPFPIIYLSQYCYLFSFLFQYENLIYLADLASIGGAIATLTYGFYILKSYRQVAD